MLAVDQQRAGQPDRHLRDPDEVLDVPGQDRRVERVGGDLVEVGPGLFLNQPPPRLGRLPAVVIVRVAGNPGQTHAAHHIPDWWRFPGRERGVSAGPLPTC